MNLLSSIATLKRPSSHLILLIGLAIIVILLPAGMWDLRGPDEGRYTRVARELLTRDNWLVLTVMEKPYDQKPPLTFWFLAGALKLNSGEPHSWFLRLPSILAAIGTLILTYTLGRRFAGSAAGFVSAMFLLTSFTFLDDAPTVELNMLYTFFTTAALAVWLFNFQKGSLTWSQWAAFWLLLTAAFMVKGPLAVLVVVSAVGYTAWVNSSWQPLRAIRFSAGFAVLLSFVGVWFYAQGIAYGGQFVHDQLKGETVQRFIQGDHAQPFYYYFPRLFTSTLGPWAFFFVAALVHLWRNRGNNTPWAAPLVGWITIPFIILVLANGKRVPYLLPLVPAACLLAGTWFHRQLAAEKMKGIYQKVLLALLCLVTVVCTVAAVVFFNSHRLLNHPDILAVTYIDRLNPWFWTAGAVVLGYIAWQFVKSKRTWAEGAWALGLAILAVHLLDYTTIRPALDRQKSTRQFSARISALLNQQKEQALLTLPDLAEPEYHVYADYKVVFERKALLDLRRPDLPKVLALEGEEIVTSGPQAMAAGYSEVFTLDVTKQPVRVYVRQ